MKSADSVTVNNTSTISVIRSAPPCSGLVIPFCARKITLRTKYVTMAAVEMARNRFFNKPIRAVIIQTTMIILEVSPKRAVNPVASFYVSQ